MAEAATLTLVAATTVSLWTARVALAATGRRLGSAIVAAIEAVTFVVAFRLIASNLDALDKVAGYALGVAAGTLLGLAANDRLSTGHSLIHLSVDDHGHKLTAQLHDLGWPATTQQGRGLEGPVTTFIIVVDDALLGDALNDIGHLAPQAFITVQRLRRVRASALPAGYRQTGSRRRRPTVTAAIDHDDGDDVAAAASARTSRHSDPLDAAKPRTR